MLPLYRSACNQSLPFIRRYCNNNNSSLFKQFFNKGHEGLKNITNKVSEGSTQVASTVVEGSTKIAAKSAEVITGAAEGAKNTVGGVKAVMVDTKETTAKMLKTVRFALGTCAFFFTADFIVKSIANICENSERIRDSVSKHQNKLNQPPPKAE